MAKIKIDINSPIEYVVLTTALKNMVDLVKAQIEAGATNDSLTPLISPRLVLKIARRMYLRALKQVKEDSDG